jgi:hypothetical protein
MLALGIKRIGKRVLGEPPRGKVSFSQYLDGRGILEGKLSLTIQNVELLLLDICKNIYSSFFENYYR